jgi:hypothetical protein
MCCIASLGLPNWCGIQNERTHHETHSTQRTSASGFFLIFGLSICLIGNPFAAPFLLALPHSPFQSHSASARILSSTSSGRCQNWRGHGRFESSSPSGGKSCCVPARGSHMKIFRVALPKLDFYVGNQCFRNIMGYPSSLRFVLSVPPPWVVLAENHRPIGKSQPPELHSKHRLTPPIMRPQPQSTLASSLLPRSVRHNP